MIFGYLIGFYLSKEYTMYDTRIILHFTFKKLIKGSIMWQMYK